jgi:hypothetical protein
MRLPVSRLFWVSSLAYPNLFGTKGYVVVVVGGGVNECGYFWCYLFFFTQLHPDSHSYSSVWMFNAMYNGQNLDSEFTI